MNEERYRKISGWFRKSEIRLKIFKCVYKILPVIVIAIYGLMIIYEIFCEKRGEAARVILVPFTTFLLCTILRKGIDAKRPYEAMNIEPLICKNKKGQSFPSRHVVSASVIAMAALFVNIPIGIIMMIITFLIAVIRPIAGVHYVRDVLGGLIWGILGGMIGFFIL